jgi:predicted dehydrogenase
MDRRRSEEIKTTATDVVAAFRMETGATGTILGSAGMSWRHPLYELVLTFEHGRLHLRDLEGTLEILDGKSDYHETRSLSRHTSRWKQYEESFGHSLTAYLNSLRNGAPAPIPGLDGLMELQFEAALKRSISERRPVDLPKEYPL